MSPEACWGLVCSDIAWISSFLYPCSAYQNCQTQKHLCTSGLQCPGKALDRDFSPCCAEPRPEALRLLPISVVLLRDAQARGPEMRRELFTFGLEAVSECFVSSGRFVLIAIWIETSEDWAWRQCASPTGQLKSVSVGENQVPRGRDHLFYIPISESFERAGEARRQVRTGRILTN